MYGKLTKWAVYYRETGSEVILIGYIVFCILTIILIRST